MCVFVDETRLDKNVVLHDEQSGEIHEPPLLTAECDLKAHGRAH